MYRKIIFFDFDGVLFDSIKNMELSWKETNKKFNLYVSFKDYRKFIGLPFNQILLNNNIHKQHNEIKKFYNDYSKKKIDLIKPYEGVREVLNYLVNQNEIYLGLYTSKNKDRAEYLLKKYNFKFHSYFFGDGEYHKPDPTPINDIKKKLNITKENIYYIGDSSTDYKLSKNSDINFCLANWGYEKFNCEIKLEKTKDILKLI